MRSTAAAAADGTLVSESSDLRRSIESQGLLTAAAHAASAPRTGVPPLSIVLRLLPLQRSQCTYMAAPVSCTHDVC